MVHMSVLVPAMVVQFGEDIPDCRIITEYIRGLVFVLLRSAAVGSILSAIFGLFYCHV